MSDATPNDELRELIEAWRGIDKEFLMSANLDTTPEIDAGIYAAYQKCADELEELIDDE